MTAELTEVKSNGHTHYNAGADIGHLASKTEPFAFRLKEGIAPVMMKVRVYGWSGLEQEAMRAEAVKLDAGHKELNLLISKRVELQVESYSDSNYDEDNPDPRLVRIDKRITELSKLPTVDQYDAEYFFCRLIDSWDFTDSNGESLPVTVEGVLSLSIVMREKLKRDLLDFLSKESQGRRKV